MIEHVLADQTGDWRVSIIGSHESDRCWSAATCFSTDRSAIKASRRGVFASGYILKGLRIKTLDCAYMPSDVLHLVNAFLLSVSNHASFVLQNSS